MSTQDGGLWLRCRISGEPQPLPGGTAGAAIVRRPWWSLSALLAVCKSSLTG